MKSVVLIGKFNEITKQIHDGLSPVCRVQLCSDNAEAAEGMLRLVGPDLVIVSLIGSGAAHTEIFSLLSRQAPETPVAVVGSKADEDELREGGFLEDKRLRFLRRPIKLEKILSCARELLRVEDDGQGGRKTILVVDDNPTFLRTMQSMLSEKYRVAFATSGPQAIAAIAKTRPALILLDYDMPVCDGKMTLKMLRSEEETRSIPVVFLTGMADTAHVQEVLSLNPQGYLLKPPTREKIFDTVERVLQERPQAAP